MLSPLAENGWDGLKGAGVKGRIRETKHEKGPRKGRGPWKKRNRGASDPEKRCDKDLGAQGERSNVSLFADGVLEAA